MEKEFYTRLVYEHKSVDDYGPRRVELTEPAWDLSANDVLEMFHTIMIGATYSQGSFENVLAEYLIERGWQVLSPEELEDEQD